MPPVFSRSKKVVKKRKCVARPKARGGRHESSPGLYQNSQGTLLPVPFLYKKMSSTTSTMYSLPLFCFPCHPSSSGSVCFFFVARMVEEKIILYRWKYMQKDRGSTPLFNGRGEPIKNSDTHRPTPPLLLPRAPPVSSSLSLRFPGRHGASKGPGAVASLRRPARGAAPHGREGVLLPPGPPGAGHRRWPCLPL
jgi:hypothetical protein